MRKYKLRSDSTFGRLTAEQREKLDDWLFTENLGYPEVLKRAQEELGVTASRSGLRRYHVWRQEERAAEDLAGADRTAKVVNGTRVEVAMLRDSSLKLIGKWLQESALAGADVETVTRLAKILLDSERRQTERERLELARERFHFNAAEAALAELPHVGQMTAEEMAMEKRRVDGIIRRLFGKELPIEEGVMDQ